MSTLRKLDLELADECAKYYADPAGWAKWAFDWDYGDLKGFQGLDTWQEEFLNDVGECVTRNKFNGVDPVDPIQLAVSSGHGIGKSALTAILLLWIMSTRPDCKGVVTANTSDQLRTKTWGELGKWKKRCIVGHWFEYNNGKGNMNMYHASRPETWRVDAQTCREENSESFAGLHAANSTPFYLFDEASAVPEKIWEVAKGGLTDGEPMFFCFGNPTRNSGTFFECFNRFKHRWITRQIDSRKAKMTNKKLLDEWIADYGEDSDFVRVRVRGLFPKAGDMQFIPSDAVRAAQKEEAFYDLDDPLVMGVDVGRGGGDYSVVQFRKGRDARSYPTYRIPGEKTRDSMKLVSRIVDIASQHKPDIVNIDGTGVGGPMVDRIREMGLNANEIQFGSTSPDDHYYLMFSYIWGKMRQWLIGGGVAIKDHPDLEAELTQREYGHNLKDQLQLESKKNMKKRGLASPDWADALALTFAVPAPPKGLSTKYGSSNKPKVDYDPFSG